MAYDAEAIIVGSGPSGVSVAFPLLAAGIPVLLLDGGKERDPGLLPSGPYHEIRQHDHRQWRFFLGPHLEVLNTDRPPSPKFDAPGSGFAYEGFNETQRVIGEGFSVVGSLAKGGLSNIWGAGIATYGEEDLRDFPLGPSDLAPSYRRIAGRIGITGFSDDDLTTDLDADLPCQPPMPLCENAQRLFSRYPRRRSGLHALGFRMGRARCAVLTQPMKNRKACTLCDMCIWGCQYDSIYSASQDLDELRSFSNLDYRPGRIVDRFEKVEGGYRVRISTNEKNEPGESLTLKCRVLILATGTLVTTRLVLDYQGRLGESLPLLGTPGIGFAVCLPERIGTAVSTREYSMAQVSFLAGGGEGPGDDAYGNLFPASGIPGWQVIDHMPLTRPVAVRVYRYLQPSLLLGNCFLPGRYSRNTARLERSGNGKTFLRIQGGISGELPERLSALKRQLRTAFLRLGALLLPNSVKVLQPGEDMRYSGTFPMRANPGPGQVNRSGEVSGSPGLFLVDMSIFPSMPAKHHTFTMMAIADRIGEGIAAGYR